MHYSTNHALAYIAIMQLNFVECFASAKDLALPPVAVKAALQKSFPCTEDDVPTRLSAGGTSTSLDV